MSIVVRSIGNADAALLERVTEDVFDEPIVADRLSAFLSEPNQLLVVALCDGSVVGQVTAYIHRHPDKQAELYVDNVGVAPAFQRQGVARRMLAEMLLLGKNHGCEMIWVATESTNEPARALYRSLGFKGEAMVWYEKNFF